MERIDPGLPPPWMNFGVSNRFCHDRGFSPYKQQGVLTAPDFIYGHEVACGLAHVFAKAAFTLAPGQARYHEALLAQKPGDYFQCFG